MTFSEMSRRRFHSLCSGTTFPPVPGMVLIAGTFGGEMFDHATELIRDNHASLRVRLSRLNFLTRFLLISVFLFAVFTIVGLLTGSVAHAADGCPKPADSVAISLGRQACAAVQTLSSAGTGSGQEQSAEGDAIGSAIRVVRSASGHRTDLVNVAEAVDTVVCPRTT